MCRPCLCCQKSGDKSHSKGGVLLEGLGQKNGMDFVAHSLVNRQSMVGTVIFLFIWMICFVLIMKSEITDVAFHHRVGKEAS